MITLQTWRVRMSEDMRLRDFRPRTQEGYALAVRLFLDWASAEFPTIPWNKRWVVFAKCVMSPNTVLDYLGRYVHRTALSDKAILADGDHAITFAYRDSRDHQRRSMTLDPHEFLRRFLQHVPLKGLHRVRAFDLLHSTERSTLRQLQLLIATPSSTQPTQLSPPEHLRRCPHCNSASVRHLRHLTAHECAITTLLADVPAFHHARAPPRRSSFLGPAAA